MKVIQSTYSLEWVISRLPSIYPSYNGSDDIVYFDEKSINDRHGEYTSNYGMIPLNVPIKLLNELNKNKDYELNFGYNLDEDSYLSWNTLSEWYSFFQNYYHILNNSGSCNRVYSSATDFYDAEYNVSSVELPLGSDRNSYKEYDLLFKERGGYISKSVLECEGASSVIGYSDIGFFKLINDYIVPSFEIPSEYKEYWHTYRIFYPDIIKWISWFENKKKEYDSNGSSETPIDCAKSDNCCACEEYIQRGGSKLLESFKMWYKAVNEKIDVINNYVSSHINNVDWHFKPYAFKEIPIFNSFEKTCLQSNFSEEYDVNVDYRHSNGNIDDEKNTMGGTVVNVSGKTMFFKDNNGHDVKSPGSIFDKYHMERKYDLDAFTDYTDYYISKKDYGNTEFWVTDKYTCYGVNKDNIKKFGKDEDDVKKKFNRSIPLDTNNGNGWFVFEDRMLKCEPIETLELENGKVIPVFRDDNTNTPFVTMGGKNIYPEFNFKDNAYRFSFGKDKLFPRNEMNTDSDYSCVNNNGNIKVFETINKTNGVTYTLSDGSTITYPYSYGYIDVDDYRLCVCDKKWFGKGENEKTIATIYPFEEVDDPTHEYEYDESVNSITIKDNGIKYFMSDVITGTTSSKLLELRSSNIMTDDSGNIIEALNLLASNSTNKDRYYVQPLLGEELEPLYQVGNVSSISPFSLTYKDYDDKEKKTIRYVGNIISKMEFYFCDKDGNIVQKKYDENSGTLVDDETGISTIDLKDKGKDKSSLNAIKPIMKAMEVYMNQSPTNVISNGLQCDITYNIGATLKMNVDENGSTTYTIDESDYGVQYTETVEFVKTKVEYYLGTDNVSYPIYIYKLKQGEGEKASFKARIDIFDDKIVDNYSKSESEGMEKYNGIEFCPTFTRAFNIGVVSLPAIESEVNIDRGNSAAFEKHLKLGEVTSFEALENYSNGYFKIMEN